MTRPRITGRGWGTLDIRNVESWDVIEEAKLRNPARLWQIPSPVQGDPEQVLVWTQVITGLELDEYGFVRVLDAATWQQRRQRLLELGGPPVN